MKRPSKQKNKTDEMPLEIMAEKALKEAVAEAIAEHKLRGHPIVVWRDGKVVSIPPEEIVVTAKRDERPKNTLLRVKERSQSYGKQKDKRNNEGK
ncbi:MAG: hypothetical protein HY879_16650 [Deltaproteobacteria bacterium]|nr:hypothetical protein [Deltaproteobacteria bacterium]